MLKYYSTDRFVSLVLRKYNFNDSELQTKLLHKIFQVSCSLCHSIQYRSVKSKNNDFISGTNCGEVAHRQRFACKKIKINMKKVQSKNKRFKINLLPSCH